MNVTIDRIHLFSNTQYKNNKHNGNPNVICTRYLGPKEVNVESIKKVDIAIVIDSALFLNSFFEIK